MEQEYNFSPKQQQVILFAADPDLNKSYAGGSVRSGKSAASLVSFAWYVMNCNFQSHLLLAPSIEAGMRNCGNDIMTHIRYFGGTADISKQFGTKIIGRTPKGVEYNIDICGATDDRAYKRIQGATYAGALIDECVSIPETAFEMALTRLSLDISKLWCTYNPDRPTHWFKLKYEDKAWDNPKIQALKFELEDNPTLSAAKIEELRGQFGGHFYKRAIEGLWAGASGLIYDKYNTYAGYKNGGKVYVAVDYGIRIFAALRIREIGDMSYIEDEVYYDNAENKTMTEAEQVHLVDKLCKPEQCSRMIVDPATLRTFKESLRRHRYKVVNADNEVNQGIRTTQNALMRGQLLINTKCKSLIRELDSYCWNPNTKEDKPVKEFDHATDAMRYYSYFKYGRARGPQRTVKGALYDRSR